MTKYILLNIGIPYLIGKLHRHTISAYFLLEDIILDPEKTYSDFQGCEFDYSSNTYRQDHQ